MARVYLDANLYIDITKRSKQKFATLRDHLLFISAVSVHILFYARKIQVPDEDVNKLQELFGIIPLTKAILNRAQQGPTKDLEDNIQLHSAAEAKSDIFLTNDKQLLRMKFFGKTQILAEVPNSF